MGRLHGPLDRPGHRCHGGGHKQSGPERASVSVRSTQLDKRSFPESAETAEGWLRASGIERGRPNRAVAQGCGHLRMREIMRNSVRELRVPLAAQLKVITISHGLK